MATTVVQDPNPAATANLDIQLPTFDDGLPPEDTSYKITVGGRGAVDAEAEAELQAAVRQEESQRIAATPQQPSVNNEVTNSPRASSPYAKQIQDALNNGYTTGELKTFLTQSKGLSEDDADLAIVASVKSQVLQARQEGYSEDEVLDYMKRAGYDEQLVTSSVKAARTDERYKDLDFKPDLSEQEKAMDIADLYKNVYQKYSTWGKQIGGVFNDEMAIEARREINQLNYAVAEKLKKEGIDAFIDEQSGEVVMRDNNGQVTEVDSSSLSGLWNSKGEFAGALSGGIAGARAGAAVGSLAGPIGTGVGTAAGALGGSMLGAAAGRGVDLAINAKKLSEDLSANLYMTQMKQAGIFDGVGVVLGATAFKLGAKSYRGIMKGYRYFSHGNPNGALRALKENLNITDDQAAEMIANWERLNDIQGTTVEAMAKQKAGQALTGAEQQALRYQAMSPAERAISVISQTGQGAEQAVRAAAAQNERIATVIRQSVNERAKGLTKAIDTVADENVGSFIRKDLKAYQDDVKSFYDVIKRQGSSEIDGTDFRFDLDKLAIEPVMKSIEARISNPAARERFVNYASRIDAASKDRMFGGLLELRAAVNDFKYSKTLSVPDVEALNAVLNKIDGQVAKAVTEYMPDTGKAWLDNFKKAKTEYSKMKVLQENSLFRLINRPGATEDSIQKALSRYGTDKDVDAELFDAITKRLSPATLAKVEGAAIKNLTNKYTFGETMDMQAVHFPQLAEELANLNITTPAAKGLKNVVQDIAKVYKNDPELAGITGRTAVTRMQAVLSADLAAKAKYSLVGAVWNNIVRYAPTQSARNTALVGQIDKLFKEPLHAKTADDLLKMVPKEAVPEVQSLIRQLQIQTAKQGGVKPQDFVNMYKRSANGKLSVSDGALGKGVYLSDKIKNPTADMKVIKHEVNMSRMATMEDIAKIAGRTVTTKDIRDNPNLARELMESGYLGIRYDDKVMLFPENTLGVKVPNTVGSKPKAAKSAEPEATQAERKASLDRMLDERVAREEASKVGGKTATQAANRAARIVKQLNDKSWGTPETRQALMDEADSIGISLYKVPKSGSAKNSTGLDTKWMWRYKKDSK